MRDYVKMIPVHFLQKDPDNPIPYPQTTLSTIYVFFADEKKAQAWIDLNLYPDFNFEISPPVWYQLDKENFITWVNSSFVQNLGYNKDFSYNASPRGAGINSTVEKDPNYSGNAASSAAKGATFTLNLDSYLALLLAECLRKGLLAAANEVRKITSDFDSGLITQAVALDRLNKVNFT